MTTYVWEYLLSLLVLSWCFICILCFFCQTSTGSKIFHLNLNDVVYILWKTCIFYHYVGPRVSINQNHSLYWQSIFTFHHHMSSCPKPGALHGCRLKAVSPESRENREKRRAAVRNEQLLCAMHFLIILYYISIEVSSDTESMIRWRSPSW